MVFQRNKELLIGVGRRDFELGSAPAFPVERLEIDLEEWDTQRSACPTLSEETHNFKKFFKRFPRLHPDLSPRELQPDTGLV